MPSKNLCFVAGLLSVLISTSSWGAIYQLQAFLVASSVVPVAPISNGAGEGNFTLDTDLNFVSVEADSAYAGLVGTAASIGIYDAGPLANGPKILPLSFDASEPIGMAGEFTGGGGITAAQAADMIAGNTYVLLTTTSFELGEIRGQLFIVPEPAAMAILSLAALLLLRRQKSA
jgi:CHRD domain